MKTRGFTLIELVVALAIFAVISVMAYSALHNALDTRAHVDEAAERLSTLQRAYSVLERDLEQVVARDIRDNFGDSRASLMGGLNSGPLLELTRTGWPNPIGRPRSHLQRVAYELRGNKLMRLSWAELDRAPNSVPLEQVLLDGVQAAEVRFLGYTVQGPATGASTWQTYWPPQTSSATPPLVTPLPRAVELSVDLTQWGRITRLFQTPG